MIGPLRPLVLLLGVVLVSLSVTVTTLITPLISLILSLSCFCFYTLSREHISFIHAHTPWLAIQPTAL